MLLLFLGCTRKPSCISFWGQNLPASGLQRHSELYWRETLVSNEGNHQATAITRLMSCLSMHHSHTEPAELLAGATGCSQGSSQSRAPPGKHCPLQAICSLAQLMSIIVAPQPGAAFPCLLWCGIRAKNSILVPLSLQTNPSSLCSSGSCSLSLGTDPFFCLHVSSNSKSEHDLFSP